MSNSINHSKFFNSKNEYLRFNSTFDYRLIKSFEFFELIFGSCNHHDDECPVYPFEKQLCAEYLEWRRQVDKNINSKKKCQKKPKYDPLQPFRYNALLQAVYNITPDDNRNNDSGRRSKTWVMVGDVNCEDDVKVCGWSSLDAVLGTYDFVITTPITYVGRRRFKKNARYMYAMVFDLDEVGEVELAEVIHQQDIGMTPQANIIVNSGDGIHLYYILEKPVPLYPEVYSSLTRIKKALTRLVWNKATSRTGEFNEVQIQPIIQPFRVPGSKTKHGNIVTAWYNADAPLHTITELNQYATKSKLIDYNSGVSMEEANAIDKGDYSTNRLTKVKAQILYPDWYQRRIVEGLPRTTWGVNRAVYDWWKKTLWESDSVAVGHRYHCIMFLAVYAKKCNIPFDELKKDALELVPRMESITKSTGRHFTEQDAMDALKAYKDNAETYPIKTISDRTGIQIQRNKRNNRERTEHLRGARALQEVYNPNWRNGNGRPKGTIITAENSIYAKKIYQWRINNPLGNKSQCAIELGISRPTVIKWWNILNIFIT